MTDQQQKAAQTIKQALDISTAKGVFASMQEVQIVIDAFNIMVKGLDPLPAEIKPNAE